ncbi:unnamed protein product [Amaranthus hypochondriacus]
MASIIMKKVTFGTLFFLIAFECISSRIMVSHECLNNDDAASCIPILPLPTECVDSDDASCLMGWPTVIGSDINKACIGDNCRSNPTIQSEPKPEETINDVKNETEGIVDDQISSTTDEVPERTLMVDSKELKRAEVGKCLTKGNVCRIPFINAINNSSYLVEDCCEGQFCDQILKNNDEFGQCCLQNDRNNCWLP